MSSIDKNSLSKIDNQLNVKRGALNMGFEADQGDNSPPKVDLNIDQENSSSSLNIPDSLKTIFGLGNMLVSGFATHQNVIVWTPLSENELTQLSQSGASVPQLQNFANAAGDGTAMFIASFGLILASHCKLSPEFKNRKKKSKSSESIEQLTQEELDLLERGMKDNTDLEESLKKMIKEREPVYDGIPKDTSEPIKIIESDSKLSQYEETLNDSELRTRKLLMSESEMSIPEIQARTNESKLKGVLRRQAEIKTEISKNGVKKFGSN